MIRSGRVGGDRSVAANALVSGCIAYLLHRRIMAWRQNNAPVPVRRGGEIVALRRVSRRGIADILGVLPGGRFLAVECKRGRRAALEPEQRAFRDEVTAAGGLYIEARDVTGLARAIDEALR